MTTDSNPIWSFTADKSLQVNSVGISDDGGRCVFGTSNEFNDGVFSTYFCDGKGNVLWHKPVSDKKTYQGVFWVSVSGDGSYVASGGEHSETDGFLKAYDGASGNILLDLALPSRVNQVSLSHDGSYLLACYASTVELFQLNDSATEYECVASESLSPYSINSCEISRSGNRAVVSGIHYSDDRNCTTATGKVFAFTVGNGHMTYDGGCELETGSMRVAVVDDGNFWAASLHDGSCMLFNGDKPCRWEWHYTPDDVSLSLAYAVDVTKTSNEDVFVACGANVHSSDHDGLLYLVKSVSDDFGYKGEMQWKADVQRSVNPGVSLDKNANYVTATDGQPLAHSTSESPGSFYLFCGATGEKKWQYDTSLMNWPMMLAYDGSSAFGGSDNGSVFYWQLT